MIEFLLLAATAAVRGRRCWRNVERLPHQIRTKIHLTCKCSSEDDLKNRSWCCWTILLTVNFALLVNHQTLSRRSQTEFQDIRCGGPSVNCIDQDGRWWDGFVDLPWVYYPDVLGTELERVRMGLKTYLVFLIALSNVRFLFFCTIFPATGW